MMIRWSPTEGVLEDWIKTELIAEKQIKRKYWRIRPGDVVIDVGADFGGYTLPAIKQGGYVFAFEPTPEGAANLARNLKLNRYENQCTILQLALGDKEDETVFLARPVIGTQGSTTIMTTTMNRPGRVVRSTSLDYVVMKLGIPHVEWIKIDVEGAEINVLMGAAETIQRFKPKVLVECHEGYDGMIGKKVRSIMLSLNSDYSYVCDRELPGWLIKTFHCFFTAEG